ncbi:MAG: hypothetical protein A3K10_12730 [Bacteroidetes bacterium RIFCSPLOWO2_12_FULL_31_6]|nr:MAG: hypothetical protein A3K10_12730 [Bacteroidetes bacterium RIFCSPLOWO2_12_FULL_31_6]
MEKCSKHNALKISQALIDVPMKQYTDVPMAKLANEKEKLKTMEEIFYELQAQLKQSPAAISYLQSRNLNNEKIEVGYNPLVKPIIKDLKNCIIFPLRDKENKIVSFYGRSISNNTDQRHFYLKDRGGIYPNYPKAETEKLIITEAIIDAATLIINGELLIINGIKPSITACFGTNGLNDEIRNAIQELPNLNEIIFAFDNDEAGNKAVEKYTEELKEQLPTVKFSKLELPCKDVNETLQAHDENIFIHLLETRMLLSKVEAMDLFFSTEKATEKKEELESLQFSQSTKTLNCSNPEQLQYNTNELLITLLGGISLQNLDRLRVTIYMRRNPHINAAYSIRQNIDLYQDDLVEKFIRRSAEKLELSTSLISKAIAELTEELEQYRLLQIENKKVKTNKIKELTAIEKQAAINYLSKADLMQRTLDDLGKTGIVGEELNRLIMYLVMTSRKRETPINILSLGSSGIGKTHLQEKVSECIPEEDKHEITVMSENAFYYFGQEELKHKLLLIEDLDGAESVLYPLRELQSKKKLSKTVTLKDSKGNLKTITVMVEGPISVSGCTTRENVYEDNANRSFLIYIDESKEQDSKVMAYQRLLSAGMINKAEEKEQQEQFKNQQRILRSIKVRNPYAPMLCIPESILKPRRTNAHYLEFIEAITFYHQYQRPIKIDPYTGEKYIETSLEDIEWANKLMAEILIRKADELTGACRNFFEKIKDYLQKEKKESFYSKALRSHLRISSSTLNRYLIELCRNGYLKITGGNKYKTGFEYLVNDYEEYSKLKQGVTSILDDMLRQIKEKTKTNEYPSIPTVSHRQNGILKTNTVN